MAQTLTQSPVAGAPASIRETVGQKRLVIIIAGVMLGMLLSSLDQTVVGTAMPRIIADLNGLQHYAWVFTSYMLASTVMVPIYGKLSDIYGRRPFFIGGMLLFLAGSALSGLSQTMTQLILFRALQGLGAGAMMPIAIAIIGDIFPPAERGKWQGLMMSVFGVSTIVGPTLGGWLTDNWSWRWVFYVNMPVGVPALLAALALPGHSRHHERRIDYLGAATLVAGAVPLLLAFSWAGTEYAWSSPQIVGLLAFALAMLALFFVVESRASEPIISPSLFKNSIFAVAVAATFLVSIGMFGAIMYLPLFVQGVIGNSATSSGAVLTPMMLGFVISSTVGGQILSRTGRYKILALFGFVLATVGMFLLSRMTAEASNVLVVRNMAITGLGIGVMMSLFTIVVQNAFPFKQLGQVTASLQFFRSIGGTIGVAILGSVMTTRFNQTLDARIPSALKELGAAGHLADLRNPQVLLEPQATERLRAALATFGPQGEALFTQLLGVIRESLATAITDLFLVGTIALLLGLVITLFLREIPLRRSHRDDALAPGKPADGDEGWSRETDLGML